MTTKYEGLSKERWYLDLDTITLILIRGEKIPDDLSIHVFKHKYLVVYL